MTARESVAYSLGRDSGHREYPSQCEHASALAARLAVSAVERFLVRVYAREG